MPVITVPVVLTVEPVTYRTGCCCLYMYGKNVYCTANVGVHHPICPRVSQYGYTRRFCAALLVDWTARLHVINHVSTRLLAKAIAQDGTAAVNCASDPLVHTKGVSLSNICKPLYVFVCDDVAVIPTVLLYTVTLFNFPLAAIALGVI